MADWLYNSPGGMSLPLPEPPVLSVSSANPYCIRRRIHSVGQLTGVEIIILHVKSFVKGLSSLTDQNGSKVVYGSVEIKLQPDCRPKLYGKKSEKGQ